MTATINIHLLGILIMTPLGIAFGQILFKLSGAKLAAEDAPLFMLVFNPVFIAAITLYATATFFWIYALKYVPLTYAYSFMALTFVFVPILAYFLLGEQFTLRYFVGASLIVAGLLVVQG